MSACGGATTAGRRVAEAGPRGPAPAGGRSPPPQVTLVALVAPSVLLLLLINGYPFIYAAIPVGTQRIADRVRHLCRLAATTHTVLNSDAFWQAARFTLLFTVVGVFGSWAVGLGMALLLRTDIPVPGGAQGAAAAALGRADRRLRDLDQLPGRDRRQPDAASCSTPSGSARRSSSLIPTWAKIIVCVYKVWISFPFMMLMASAALVQRRRNRLRGGQDRRRRHREVVPAASRCR